MKASGSISKLRDLRLNAKNTIYRENWIHGSSLKFAKPALQNILFKENENTSYSSGESIFKLNS